MKISKKLKSNSGITLVALITTIIVLLVLAIVSIRLVMNGGIIDRAERGTQAYSEAEIEEQIKLAYQEYQMAKFSETGYTLQNALAKTGLNIVSIDGNDLMGYEIIVTNNNNELLYSINSDGKPINLTNVRQKWIEIVKGTYRNSITGQILKIGDIIYYNVDKINYYETDINKGVGINVNGYTSGSQTGPSSRKCILKSGTYSTETLRWRVLGVDTQGRIELICENAPSKQVYLANEEGYLYGPSELNKMCDELYGRGKGALSARSLNIEDVNKLAGINTDKDKRKAFGEYGDKWQYQWNKSKNCIQYRKDIGKGYTDWQNSSYNYFRLPGDSEDKAFGKGKEGISQEIILRILSVCN